MKQFSGGSTYLAGFFLCSIFLASGVELKGQEIPLAVLDFDGIGISQPEATALSNRLRNELFRLGKFYVVDRGMMETILAEQDFQQTGCTSNDCLVEVGKLLGAQQMVGGSVSKVGRTFTVSARLVDVETGRVLSVSDFDLRGELDDMLTRGMAQVAAMLSLSATDDDLPAVAEFEELTLEPAPQAAPEPIVAAPPAQKPVIQPRSKVRSASASPRFQVAFAFPDWESGMDVRVSWFPMRQRRLGPLTLLPAVTGGLYTASEEWEGEEYGTDLYYLLLETDVVLSLGKLGVGINLGAGFAAGEDWSYTSWDGDEWWDVSGMVISAGMMFSYRISRFNLILETGIFEGESEYGGLVFGAGVQF